MSTLSTVFYYASDLSQATTLWIDVLGFEPNQDTDGSPDWIELKASPTIFLNRVEQLVDPDSAIGVQVTRFDETRTSCEQAGFPTGEIFEVEPGHRALNVQPAGCQSLLIHQ